MRLFRVYVQSYICTMSPDKIIQYQNEIYTKIIMDELRKQKAAGTAIGDYILDKYEIDRFTSERLKQLLAEEVNQVTTR